MRLLVDDRVEDLERARKRLARHRTAEPTQHLLDHVVHVAAANERIGVGLERDRLQLAFDQPPHRAVAIALERAGREDPAMADMCERRVGQRADR